MRTKTITIDCGGCEFCTVDDMGQFQCSWGIGKPKRMQEPKGKKIITCKLIKKEGK